MAGTENGDSCLCGNFLNGTQQMEESVCSMSCSGDATQMCGGLNALSCYNPDGEPYGWASAGPQLRTPTMSPPEVAGLDIGGVAHTQITTPAIIFPAGNVDVGNLISKYGKTTRQPLGDFPRDLTFSSPPSSQSISTPFDGGAAAPGRGPTPSVPGDSGSSAGPSITPGASNTLSSPGNPNNPTASVTLNSSDTPSTPDQGAPPTSSNNRGLSTTPPGGNSPAGSNSSPASNNPGSGTTTTSLNNPSTNAPSPSTSSTSTPNSVGGAAPGQGQSPSAPPGESPSSAPSGGSTTSPTTVSISTTSASISPTESSSPGPETTASSASVPSGSILCIPGKDANCTPTSGSSGSKSCVPGADINCGPTPSNSNANPSSSPGQSQGSTTMPTCPPGGNANNPSTTPGQAPGTTLPSGGESPPGLSPPSSGGSSISIPSSSPPLSGGWVAPHSQISTTSLPGGSSIACTPGSSESACISPTSGGSPPPQPTTSSPNTNSPACSPGSKDPACTSPVGGGIPPGNGQPSTSTPDSIPGSCTAGSTDPACTSPNGGGNVAPGQNQPTSATNPPGAPSESTTFISNSITSGSTIGSTPSGHSGPNSKTTLPSPESNSLTTTNQESPPPPGLSESTQVSSSTLSGSGSTPNGFGGVAPGGQSPTTSSAVSSGQTPVTASVPPEGSSGSVIPTETSSKPPTSNKQTSSPNVPGHSNPPNPAGTGPQTSYTYPPGLVPYGGSSPVMTTLASMLAWREPDGVAGAPTMLHPATIHNDSDLPQELPALEFEEAPTTATRFSQPADPRWQRIRPVYVW
ncbi:hypothetical protein RRF57_006280 [Xylaria bambusicola]|uniref:WSC domain-containing protein n=1 Tax=Xylaria bambusicola TaxID=326684 RepID=A0AAN7UE22_9PEZI